MAGAGVGGAGGAAAQGSSGSAGQNAAMDAGAGTSSKSIAVDYNHQAFWMKAAPHVNRIYMSETVAKGLYVTENDGGTWTQLASKTTDGKAVDAHFWKWSSTLRTLPTTRSGSPEYGAVGVYYTSYGGKHFSSTCFQHMESSWSISRIPRVRPSSGPPTARIGILSTDGGKTCASILDALKTADPAIKSANSPLIVDSQTFVVAVGGYGEPTACFVRPTPARRGRRLPHRPPVSRSSSGPMERTIYALYWNRGINLQPRFRERPGAGRRLRQARLRAWRRQERHVHGRRPPGLHPRAHQVGRSAARGEL